MRRRQVELTTQLTDREAADGVAERMRDRLAAVERDESGLAELCARLSVLDDELARTYAELKSALTRRFLGQWKAGRLNDRLAVLGAER